ncbi:hypothetical protein NE236_13080 [Actinoallomurus purpureus]|uniref:hypothetical protein n=1 Tax=Actinoallomurus purpureus TaxID=478114 RepID=UPI0020936372|nr:hypothetical protein [Actinoallomurus purpureus]MCO6005919.1 hypothetical protein [Actinoallomurus purpureus]
MSYPYPPTGPGEQPPGGQPGGWGAAPPPGGYGPSGPGEQPPGGQPGGWGAAPPPGGYGPSGPGWQHQETMAGGVPMGPPQMMPPPPMGPMGQPPMGPLPMGPPPKKGNGAVVFAAIATAVVVVGGVLGGAYYAASRGGSGDKTSGATPAAVGTPGAGQTGAGQPGSASGQYKPGYYDATKSWSLWNNLNTASQDSRPMSLEEVFGGAEAKAQTNNTDHITMQLQGNGRLDTDCASTVWGSGLKTALQSYGCTQAIRAAYVSSDQRWIGQLVIFNLRDVNAANTLIQDMDPEAGNKGFFLPVSGPSPVDRFGKGSTGASGGAYGHYVVIGWAGSANGSESSSGTIAPGSLVERAGKTFLFSRN